MLPARAPARKARIRGAATVSYTYANTLARSMPATAHNQNHKYVTRAEKHIATHGQVRRPAQRQRCSCTTTSASMKMLSYT